MSQSLPATLSAGPEVFSDAQTGLSADEDEDTDTTADEQSPQKEIVKADDAKPMVHTEIAANGAKHTIEVSLCGGLNQTDLSQVERDFDRFRLTFDAFVDNPTILQSPHLVFRIDGQYHNWTVGACDDQALWLTYVHRLPHQSSCLLSCSGRVYQVMLKVHFCVLNYVMFTRDCREVSVQMHT